MTDEATLKQPQCSDAASWTLVGGLLAAVLTIQTRAPLPLELAGLFALGIACGALGAATLFYSHVRVQEKLAVTCLALIQVILFSTIGSVLSYMLARTGGPLWDEQLMGWDRALGFDWLAYVRFVDSYIWLVAPLRLAYGSLIPQIIVLLLAFGFSGRLWELRCVILAAILCGTATVLLSPLFPALSSYVYLGLTADDFRYVDPWAGYVHVAHFTALREGTVGLVRIPEMEGLITFPSYHAGLSAVTLWGFWMTRLSWLRWPGICVALATIAATPVDGGHYFVDLIAGIVLAVLSIAAAKRWVGWNPINLPLTASPFRRSHVTSAQ